MIDFITDEVKQDWSLVARDSDYWEFWHSIVEWLVNEIGPMNKHWTYRWEGQQYHFYFKHEEDKVKFILRWL